MKNRETRQKEAQQFAYINRDKIKLGDTFLWHFAGGYGTSGRLKKKYMPVYDEITGTKVMKVEHVHVGRNGHGYFVDYYLSADGMHLIINGPDAFKMERVKT